MDLSHNKINLDKEDKMVKDHLPDKVDKWDNKVDQDKTINNNKVDHKDKVDNNKEDNKVHKVKMDKEEWEEWVEIIRKFASAVMDLHQTQTLML